MSTLEKVEAWLALCEAKARYCRLLDIKDWDGFANLMTEDIALDLSGTSNLGVINGRAAVLKQIRTSIETARTAHQVHNPEISVNGDEAKVIWAMQDRVVWGPEKPSLVGYGHYHERWVKHGGEWKLAAQKLTRLQMDITPPTKHSDKN
jgi:3-phenylpropionate/cinnamic acid dioxygenase small subunit